jgi:uncharacterized protein YpmB
MIFPCANKLKMKTYFFILVAFLLLPVSPVFAQADTITAATKSPFDDFEKSRNATPSASDSLVKYEHAYFKQKMRTDLARERYFEKQYDFYFTESLKQRYETFQWQQESGKIIFWVVIAIVFIALFFAAVQFRITMRQLKMRQPKGAKELQENVVEKADVHEVELSMKGVKVNSSVLGVVILVISLAFLYLYLVFVYPINNVKLDAFDTTSSVSK